MVIFLCQDCYLLPRHSLTCARNRQRTSCVRTLCMLQSQSSAWRGSERSCSVCPGWGCPLMGWWDRAAPRLRPSQRCAAPWLFLSCSVLEERYLHSLYRFELSCLALGPTCDCRGPDANSLLCWNAWQLQNAYLPDRGASERLASLKVQNKTRLHWGTLTVNA